MPSDDKLSFLEQLSNVLAGQSATAGAKALGEGIGYGIGGGALSDIPQVMREAIERHKEKSAAPKPKSEQDALELASALAAMSNPVSLAGHAVDFAGAIPSMIEQKISGAELPTGEVMQSGLKRRLAKGGAQADFARANQIQRAKANLENRNIKFWDDEKLIPIQSTGAKWGPGEGKFQAIEDYNARAFDLAQQPYNRWDVGMGKSGKHEIMEGEPHDLGIEFHNTIGLAPRYIGKGYGKQIYQNMADEYGGGISDVGSTTEAARRVYDRLGAIDTGIPSGGGTRMALPTREMKANPEALAAFEQKVKEYAESKKIEKQQRMEAQQQAQNQPAPRPEFQYDFQSAINAQPATEQNRLNNYLRSSMFNNGIPASDMQMILQRFGVGNYALPNEFTIGGRRYRFEQNPDGTRPRYVALD